MNTKILETYKGYEISVDTSTSRFRAENKKLGIDFEDTTIFGLKLRIDESGWQEPKETKAIIKWGSFDNRLAKITILRVNPVIKSYTFRIDDLTDGTYDIGRTFTEKIKYYPVNESTLKLYDQVLKLQNEIEDIEEKQRILVASIKK